MRNKVKHLMAKARAKSASRVRVPPVLHASTEAVEARRKRLKRLKDMREINRSRGLPPGFHRFPTSEELIEIRTNKAIKLQNLADKITKKSLKAMAREVSLNDIMFFAKYES